MALPFKLSVLTFLKNKAGQHALLRRLKAPNLGLWSPLGGKLQVEKGESPFACAQREIFEEAALSVTYEDLHLFGYLAEQAYEDQAHWLVFLFDCQRPLNTLPENCNEGELAFFSRSAIDHLHISPTDQSLLWPYYDRYCRGFVAINANCGAGKTPQIEIEKSLPNLLETPHSTPDTPAASKASSKTTPASPATTPRPLPTP